MSAFKEGLLKGKAAFVAGGTSGINIGIAKRFADLGAQVAVAGRDPGGLAAACRSQARERRAEPRRFPTPG